MGKIVVVGSINMDICYRVAHIPAPGETIIASDVIKSPGGKGANQAVAAAKLGANVAMIGCIGNDGDGDTLYHSLADVGVDLTMLKRCADAQTGTAFINVSDDGENNIVVHPGANACVNTELLENPCFLLLFPFAPPPRAGFPAAPALFLPANRPAS